MRLSEIHDGSAFCSNCGTAVPSDTPAAGSKFCSYCGAQLNPGAVFSDKCCKPLNPAQPPQQTYVQPAPPIQPSYQTPPPAPPVQNYQPAAQQSGGTAVKTKKSKYRSLTKVSSYVMADAHDGTGRYIDGSSSRIVTEGMGETTDREITETGSGLQFRYYAPVTIHCK